MIIVQLKVNRTLTAEYWKEQALGTTDSYGNPFRIIKVRWINSREHKNAEYAKTRGFEDAVISRGGLNGNFKITYRRNGCISWQRPAGGVGPFFGEVASTPYNIEKLAATFGDKLFKIVDADINAIAEAKYNKRVAEMDDANKEFNKKRIRSMHTLAVEADIKLPEGERLDTDRKMEQEQARVNNVAVVDLDKRMLELNEREAKINAREAALAADKDVSPIQYSELYLKGLKLFELRNLLSKDLKIKWEPTSTREDLIPLILSVQSGVKQDKKKETEEKPDSLEA